jgi:hypothetical protein
MQASPSPRGRTGLERRPFRALGPPDLECRPSRPWAGRRPGRSSPAVQLSCRPAALLAARAVLLFQNADCCVAVWPGVRYRRLRSGRSWRSTCPWVTWMERSSSPEDPRAACEHVQFKAASLPLPTPEGCGGRHTRTLQPAAAALPPACFPAPPQSGVLMGLRRRALVSRALAQTQMHAPDAPHVLLLFKKFLTRA